MGWFENMQPLVMAAWVSGCISLVAIGVTTLVNIVFSHRTNAARQGHEKELAELKATLDERSKVNDRLFDSELVKLRDELERNRAAKEKDFNDELERLKATLKTRVDVDASTIPLQHAVRTHMSDTRNLINEVYGSFNNLAARAPSLTEDEVLEQTTITLDLYAGYRNHLSSPLSISYTPDLQKNLDAFQKTLSRIFLDLQIDDESRKDINLAAKLRSSLDTLRGQKDAIRASIECIVRVPLYPLQ